MTHRPASHWSVEDPPGREEETRLETNVGCGVHGVIHAHMRDCDVANRNGWTCEAHPEVTRYTAGAITAHVVNDAAGLPL